MNESEIDTTETSAGVDAASLDAAATASSTGIAAELESELASIRALADERLAELAYARAEIENVRQRHLRTAEERVTAGRKALLLKFLPVLDNLQRALAFDDSEHLRGGLQATLKGFESALASEGVSAIEVVGAPYDPHVAEAIATRDSTEHDDVVVEEIQRGYRLGDVVMRPALVVVAKHAAAAEDVPAQAGDEAAT